MTSSLKWIVISLGVVGVVLGIVSQADSRTTANSELTLASFNIQNFGLTKAQDQNLMTIIVKILQRYDIIFVQEIVDRKERAFEILMDELNRATPNDIMYDSTLSDRIGRTAAKEQYAYIYRRDKVKEVPKAYLFPDKKDNFERPPYVVRFKANKTKKGGVQEFILVGIHIKPSNATQELQHLDEVIEKVKTKSIQDVVALGDFNADCSYVRKKHWAEIPLWTNDNYLWLIDHDVDTTTTPSDCAYDRIILSGNKIKKSYVEGSAKPFHFDQEYNLDDETTKRVSDHYPVEAKFQFV